MERREEEISNYVKRVVLPSGKTIEVVYFKDPVEETNSLRPAAEPDQDLHVCPNCDSQLVHPTGWEEASPDSWLVNLRCPECEEMREGVFSQSTVEAFDVELDAGTDTLMADYRRLTRANMADEIDRFAAAVQAGAILPEDF